MDFFEPDEDYDDWASSDSSDSLNGFDSGLLPSYSLAPQSCAICRAKSPLLHCSSCKVVTYCGTSHQTVDRPKHKAICTTIRKARETLEKEEAALRAAPDDMFLPTPVFEKCVGKFWDVLDTRDYMRARFAVVQALLKVDTARAVEQALEHLNDMLRLCRSDNLGVRDIVPDLLLRLGREQECYDFIKWWATWGGGSHDLSDVTLPYLDIQGADVFESIDAVGKHLSLSHLVSLTLLKLRLYLDLEAFEDDECLGRLSTPDRPVGKLVRKKVRRLDFSEIPGEVRKLKN